MAIVFDTETTGLTLAGINDLSKQPKIIEFGAIKLCDEALKKGEYKELARMSFLVNPRQKIPAQATKIHGIKDEDLIDQQEFSYHFPKIVNFFFAEKYLVAHNIAFDIALLKFELQRLGRLTQFPWPPVQICTVNKTMAIKGFRMNLGQLHEHCIGEIMPKGHRAMVDVEALAKCFVELVKTEVIKL